MAPQAALRTLTQAAGNYTITATATDEDGTYAPVSRAVTVNTPPSIQNPGARQNTLNVPLNLQIIATDPDAGDTIKYSASGLPTGLAINTSTGLISGTPTKNGTLNVTVSVTDSRGATASAAFSWSITKKATTPAPVVNFSANPTTIAPGQSSTLSWTASNATSCSASGGWSGTRPTAGTQMRVACDNDELLADLHRSRRKHDTDGHSHRPVQSPPTIESPGPQIDAVGDDVSLQISASDPTNDALTYSASGLPAGLAIGATSGVISGTLVAAGNWDVVVTVNDGKGGTASAGFTWTVSGTSNSPPTVANPGEQRGIRGRAVTLQIQATDIDGDTLSYSAVGLPGGLTINATTGLISGELSTNGKITTTVTVRDPNGGATSVSFRWSVSPK